MTRSVKVCDVCIMDRWSLTVNIPLRCGRVCVSRKPAHAHCWQNSHEDWKNKRNISTLFSSFLAPLTRKMSSCSTMSAACSFSWQPPPHEPPWLQTVCHVTCNINTPRWTLALLGAQTVGCEGHGGHHSSRVGLSESGSSCRGGETTSTVQQILESFPVSRIMGASASLSLCVSSLLFRSSGFVWAGSCSVWESEHRDPTLIVTVVVALFAACCAWVYLFFLIKEICHCFLTSC